MIVSCIGDSLTEGDYGIKGKKGIANVQKENYPYFLQQILQCEVRNFGKSGYKSSHFLAYYKSGEVDVTNSNFVIVMLGTNGGQSESDDDCLENKSYAELVKLLQKDAPNAKILLCTPPHVTTNPDMSNCGYAKQVKQAVLFVRKFAKDNGFDVIELAKCNDFCDENENVMQPNDGLHFSEIGYQAMAQFVASYILKLM